MLESTPKNKSTVETNIISNVGFSESLITFVGYLPPEGVKSAVRICDNHFKGLC